MFRNGFPLDLFFYNMRTIGLKGYSSNFKMKLYYTHILEIILIVYLKNWRMWINQQSEYLFMKGNALLNIALGFI